MYLQATFAFIHWLKHWGESVGKVQLEHYDNAMSCLTMVIKGVSKKARQDTRQDKCMDICRTTPPTSWEVKCCPEEGISFGKYDN